MKVCRLQLESKTWLNGEDGNVSLDCQSPEWQDWRKAKRWWPP
jgi:hypothetical protein